MNLCKLAHYSISILVNSAMALKRNQTRPVSKTFIRLGFKIMYVF